MFDLLNKFNSTEINHKTSQDMANEFQKLEKSLICEKNHIGHSDSVGIFKVYNY